MASVYWNRTQVAFLFFIGFLFLVPSTSYSATLEQEPITILSDGRVLSRLKTLGDFFIWDPSTKTSKRLLSPKGLAYAGYTTTTSTAYGEVSPTGNAIIIQESSGYPVVNELTILSLEDTSYPSQKWIETRALNIMPKISPDGLYFSMSGKLDPSSYEYHLWKFDLAEYLWDIEKGTAQPSGFYTSTQASKSGYYSNNFALVWSPDSTKIAIAEYDSTYQLRVLNLATNKFETILQDNKLYTPKQLFWPANDTLYVHDYYGNLLKVNIPKKTMSVLKSSTLDPSTSPDGNWLGYSANLGTTAEARVLDTTTEIEYKIQNCSGLKFSVDGLSVLLSQCKKDKDAFSLTTLALKDLIQLAQDNKTIKNSVAFSDLKKLMAPTGKEILSEDLPSDPTEFKKHYKIELNPPLVLGSYMSTNALLSNISDKYHTFKTKGYYPYYCALKDPAGTIVADNAWAKTYSYGGRDVHLGPNKAYSGNCYLNSISTLTPGTEYTFSVELLGYEKQSYWETKIKY